jgi:hypothetical protein
LESIFNYYYDHTSNKPEIQTKAEKLSAHVGILSGMTSSRMAYNNYASNFADPVFGKSVNIAGGIFLNIGFPKNQGKLSLMNELIFTTYKFKDSVTEGMYTNTYILGYSYIKLNNIIRYKFPLGNFSVFFDAGISNGYAIHETNFWQRFSDYSVYAPARAISEIRKYEQSYLLGIGSGFKNFTFELRREKGNGITDFETLNSATTRLYFLLGYQF